MAWYLSGYSVGGSTDWVIQDGVDLEALEKELSEAPAETFVPVSIRLGDQLQTTTLHFAPSKWNAWMLSEAVPGELI